MSDKTRPERSLFDDGEFLDSSASNGDADAKATSSEPSPQKPQSPGESGALKDHSPPIGDEEPNEALTRSPDRPRTPNSATDQPVEHVTSGLASGDSDLPDELPGLDAVGDALDPNLQARPRAEPETLEHREGSLDGDEVEQPVDAGHGPPGQSDPASEQPTGWSMSGPVFRGVLFPTNRYNLIEILTSGLIKPRAGYRKYYADLLDVVPGYVPLLRLGIDIELGAALSIEDPTALPVVLSLDPDVLPDDESARRGIVLVPGVLPASAINAVLVRSPGDMSDIVSRQLANLDWGEVPIVVEPAAFAGPTTFDDIKRALSDSESVPSLAARTIDDADRIAGGLALAFGAVRTQNELEILTRLLAGQQHHVKRFSGPLEFLAGGRLRSFEPMKLKSPENDQVLFESAIEAVLEADPLQRWSPIDVLGRTWELATVASEAISDEFGDAFEYMSDVIRVATDLVPFRMDASPVPKAILMFLLRPKPGEVGTWRDSEYNARQPELIGAAALSGVLAGYAQLPVESRPGDLAYVLEGRQTMVLNRGLAGAISVEPLDRQDVEVSCQVGTGGRGVLSSSIGSQDVFQTDLALDLATLLINADFDGQSRVLIDFVRELGWEKECLTTSIPAKPERRKSGETETRFPGYWEPIYEVGLGSLRSLLLNNRIPNDVEEIFKGRIIEEIDAERLRSRPGADSERRVDRTTRTR